MESEGKILVISRDALEGQSVRKVLGAEGYVVQHFSTASEATNNCDMDSFDILVASLESSSELKGLSDLASDTDVIAIMDTEDGEHSIQRPVNPLNLVETVQLIMTRRRRSARRNIATQQGAQVLDGGDSYTAHEGVLLSRTLEGGLLELSIDIGPWSAQGKMLCVEFTSEDETITEGQSFGRMFTGQGDTLELIAPFGGSVIERNAQANSAMCVLMRECPNEGCLLWLLRVRKGNE